MSRESVDVSSAAPGGRGSESPKKSIASRRGATGAVADMPIATAGGAESPEGHTFTIFRDSQGMYRWTLNDHAGRSLGASQFGFAVFAGALQDVELERSDARYAHATVRDDTDA